MIKVSFCKRISSILIDSVAVLTKPERKNMIVVDCRTVYTNIVKSKTYDILKESIKYRISVKERYKNLVEDTETFFGNCKFYFTIKDKLYNLPFCSSEKTLKFLILGVKNRVVPTPIYLKNKILSQIFIFDLYLYKKAPHFISFVTAICFSHVAIERIFILPHKGWIVFSLWRQAIFQCIS